MLALLAGFAFYKGFIFDSRNFQRPISKVHSPQGQVRRTKYPKEDQNG